MPMPSAGRYEGNVARLEIEVLIVSGDKSRPGGRNQDLVSRMAMRPIARAVAERHRRYTQQFCASVVDDLLDAHRAEKNRIPRGACLGSVDPRSPYRCHYPPPGASPHVSPSERYYSERYYQDMMPQHSHHCLLPEEDVIDDPGEDDESDPLLPGDLWYRQR